MNRFSRHCQWGLYPLLTLFCLVGAGCVGAYIKKVPGSKVPEHLSALEGEWKGDTDTIKAEEGSPVETCMIKVADPAVGRIIVTSKDKDGKASNGDFYVRSFGSRQMVFTPADEKDKPGMYQMLLLNSLGKDSMVLVMVNAEALARLVKEGSLHGSTELDDNGKLKNVILDDLSEEECNKLFDGPNKDSFYWENSLVFVRAKPR